MIQKHENGSKQFQIGCVQYLPLKVSFPYICRFRPSVFCFPVHDSFPSEALFSAGRAPLSFSASRHLPRFSAAPLRTHHTAVRWQADLKCWDRMFRFPIWRLPVCSPPGFPRQILGHFAAKPIFLQKFSQRFSDDLFSFLTSPELIYFFRALIMRLRR